MTIQAIDTLLDERELRYGSFQGHAMAAQALKDVLKCSPHWESMRPTQAEALEMICHKMARILNGDPDYTDNWTDIAGYATLVVRDLSCAE